MSQLVAVQEARTGAELLSRYAETRVRLWTRPRPVTLKPEILETEPERIEAVAVYAHRRVVGPRKSLPKIESIIFEVVEHFGVSRVDLLSARRTRNIVNPRHVAMFLASTMTPFSLPQIGRQLGGKDHTTVLHGVRRIAHMIAAGDPIAEDVAAIKAMLG